MKNGTIWSKGARCAITFSFDDGYRQTLNCVLPLLQKYNFKATFNIISGLVGQKIEGLEIAGWKEWQSVAWLGNEIASHSMTHRGFHISKKNSFIRFIRSFPNAPNKLAFLKRSFKFAFSPGPKEKKNDVPRLIEELKLSKEEILKRIFRQRHLSFVYPGGNYDKRLKFLVKYWGYSSARALDIGFNTPGNLDFYALKVQMWDSSTTAGEANKWIDEAIKKESWLVECLHLVGERDTANHLYFTQSKEFEEHLKYVSSKECWVATQKEIVNWII